MIYLLVGWLFAYLYVLYYIYKNWKFMVASSEILQSATVVLMEATPSKRRALLIFILISCFVFTPLFVFVTIKADIKKLIKKIKPW